MYKLPGIVAELQMCSVSVWLQTAIEIFNIYLQNQKTTEVCLMIKTLVTNLAGNKCNRDGLKIISALTLN